MNILTFPELFNLTSTSLNDKEKIFLASCSKMTYNFKSLIILDSEYYLEEIHNKWHVRNIIIKNFSLESKIKELIENSVHESIIVYSGYVKFISNDTNIKLFYNKNIIEKIISYDCHYMVMKIMLNNQFIEVSKWNYFNVIKLLIDLAQIFVFTIMMQLQL